MQVILTFKNGDKITIPVAEQSSGFWDVFVHLKAINELDSPFEVVLSNGETYVTSGKELISVEMKF